MRPRDVRRLVVVCLLREVRHQAAEGRARGRRRHGLAAQARREEERAEKAAGRALHVPLDPRDLPREVHAGHRAEREIGREHLRRVHERVAVHRAEPEELGLFQPRDHAKNTELLGVFHPRLEADEVVSGHGRVLRAELDHRVGAAPRVRVLEADRLHRPVAQRVLAALRHDLARQAPLEVLRVLELARRHLLGRRESAHEGAVLRLVEGAVHVRLVARILILAVVRIERVRGARVHRDGVLYRAALAVARLLPHAVPEDRVRRDDRRDRVVVGEVLPPHDIGQVLRERIARERARREDHGARVRDPRHLLAGDLDVRVAPDRAGDLLGEPLAIHGERAARGDRRAIRGAHHERAGAPHLLLEQADGVRERRAAQRVGADELGEVIRRLRGRALGRLHLEEPHGDAALRELERGLAACQAPADDGDPSHSAVFVPRAWGACLSCFSACLSCFSACLPSCFSACFSPRLDGFASS